MYNFENSEPGFQDWDATSSSDNEGTGWRDSIDGAAITAPEDAGDYGVREELADFAARKLERPLESALPDQPGFTIEAAPPLTPPERPQDESQHVSFLSFRQPFDGSQPELPSHVQIEAGTAFARLVEQEVDEGLGRETVKRDTEGQLLRIKVSQEYPAIRPQDPAEKRITVEGLEIITEGLRFTGYKAEYRLDIDGVVRRRDTEPRSLEDYTRRQERMAALTDLMASAPDKNTVGEDGARQYAAEAAGVLVEALHEALAERLAPQELGEQNQPVGPQEIEMLRRLIEG